MPLRSTTKCFVKGTYLYSYAQDSAGPELIRENLVQLALRNGLIFVTSKSRISSRTLTLRVMTSWISSSAADPRQKSFVTINRNAVFRGYFLQITRADFVEPFLSMLKLA